MTNAAGVILIRDEMSEKIVKAAEEIALSDGTGKLTVRKILKKLDITNRVFYNRFRNIGEVLGIVYKNTVHKVRACITEKLDPKRDFFEQVNELISKVISMSYDTRKKISGFVFESDLVREENRKWWTEQIRELLQYAMDNGFIKKVDANAMSYSIWCFIRGYNADAVSRNIPKEEAINGFRYTFSFLLDGLKA